MSCPVVDFKTLVFCTIEQFLGPVVPVLVALALVTFLYGLIVYVKNADNDTKRSEGRNLIFYGVIALFVMVGVWGLVAILVGTFNLDNATPPAIPTTLF